MVKKPAYMYEFPTEEAANQFYSLAMFHQKSKIVQHPQQNGVQDSLRVLVTGSGSNVYDMLLRLDLTKQAEALGGRLVPKV